MTIRELAKYRHIKLEIIQIENNLEELNKTYVGSSKVTAMPKSKGSVGNPIEQLQLKKERLIKKLEKKKDNLLSEQEKIEIFLEDIEDASIRIIIRSRFIDGKSWTRIGRELHFDRTTPYYHLKKFLEEYEKKRKNAEDAKKA